MLRSPRGPGPMSVIVSVIFQAPKLSGATGGRKSIANFAAESLDGSHPNWVHERHSKPPCRRPFKVGTPKIYYEKSRHAP